MIFPSLAIFKELARQGNQIPVYTEITSDLETPVSAYAKLADGEHDAFLLESAEHAERFGRYSFVGANPSVIFEMRGKRVRICDHGEVSEYETGDDPLQELQAHMSRYKPISFGDLPIFYGGAVGFLSYEAMGHFEPKVRPAANDDLGMPDAYFVVSDSLLIFDHLQRRIKVLVNCHVRDGDDPEAAYNKAVERIEAMLERLRRSIPGQILFPSSAPENVSIPPEVNMTQEQYVQMTERMKEYIFAGDIFQVVPSQRFAAPFEADPLVLYRALRFVNPSPYMFLLKFGEQAVVGSSPETHVRCENGVVQIRPIAGTRPRRPRREDDEAMARELLGDEKERAEHVMLVDLARNDVGRVCEYNSVKVTDFMTIERYSHVMHIVSNVKGSLRSGLSAYDVMRATFPAGTVTGSPKIRAMQIISELEPTCRGVYSGAVGYFGFSGNLDSAISIRTMVVKNGKAYAQAGGGLVADSTAMGEYNESVNKAKAAFKAISLAQSC